MARSIPAVSAFSLAVGLALSCLFVSPSGIAGMAARLDAVNLRQGGRGAQPATPPPATARILEGTNEHDTLSGDAGDDWLFGRNGSDFLRGLGGRDKLDGGEGDDTLDGGADADILDGGAGSDTIRGGDGDDTLDGGDDDDLLDGGPGVDDIDGGDGSDVLRGGLGNDVLAGGDENDSLNGGPGNDRLSGQDGADTLAGGAGDDALAGGNGDDVLDGEAGDDRLDGEDGNDILRGGAGNDLLLGREGDDTLNGLDGNDTLMGGNGNDVLVGGLGYDWIFGGTGLDVCLGGGGDDLFIIRAGDVPPGAIETINGGDGNDVLILNGFPTVTPLPASTPNSPPTDWQIVDPLTGGTYRIAGIERVEYTQIHTEIGQGANRTISLLLVNPSSTPTAGRVLFFTADGSIVPAASGGQAAREELTFTVPALGSVRLDAVVQGSVTAQVFAAAPLATLLRGGVESDGSTATGDAPFGDSVLVPVMENRAAESGTGVLIANSIAQSTVRFSLNSADGLEAASDVAGPKAVVIPAYGHRVVFVRDLFPNLGDFQGTLTVEGGFDRSHEGGPVSVVGVERGPSGRLVFSPSLPISADRLAETQHFARLTTGGDVLAEIVLVNPSPRAPATGTLKFFNDGGLPWAVSINRQAPAATQSYEIPPLGMQVFTTVSGGSAQTGSFRVEPTEGAIGAVLRESRSSDVARIRPSAAVSHFIAAASRHTNTGLTTQVSLASTRSAAVARLTLRRADGAEVTGGTAEMRLPANGQATRTLEQLFPTAALDAFDGTITVRADGGIAATVMQTTGGSRSGLVLPIAAIR